MRPSLRFGLLGWLALSLGCGEKEDPVIAQDSITASALLAELRMQDYTMWPRPPAHATRVASSAPHGDSVDIYINSVMDAARQNPATRSAGRWPVDGIIVKEGFEGGVGNNDRIQTLIMKKVERGSVISGTHEAREAGWFWAEFNAVDDVDFAGTNEDICVSCHEAAPFDQVYEVDPP